MKIAEDIYVLRPSRGSLVYILAAKEGLTVIDTGSEPGNADIILGYTARKLGRNPHSIKNIFLTHWHGDHSGAAERLREMTGAPISCHRNDAPLLSGQQEVDVFWERPMPRQGLNHFLKGVCAIGYMTMNSNNNPLTPDVIVDEGPAPFDQSWSVLSLPGHTPGSCGLWSESRRMLFCGDTVLVMGKGLDKPFPFLIEDRKALQRSWDKLAALGTIDWIMPGHFKPLRFRGVIAR